MRINSLLTGTPIEVMALPVNYDFPRSFKWRSIELTLQFSDQRRSVWSHCSLWSPLEYREIGRKKHRESPNANSLRYRLCSWFRSPEETSLRTWLGGICGFCAGYWARVIGGRGFSVVVKRALSLDWQWGRRLSEGNALLCISRPCGISKTITVNYSKLSDKLKCSG